MIVKCTSCGRKIAETTIKFDPDRRANGSFVKPIGLYATAEWLLETQWTASTTWPELCCPECTAQLAPNGFFTFAEPDVPDLTQAEKNQALIDAEFGEEKNKTRVESIPKSIKTAMAVEMVEDIMEKVAANNIIRPIIVKEEDGTEKKFYKCPKCGKVCKSKGGLAMHAKTCKGV